MRHFAPLQQTKFELALRAEETENFIFVYKYKILYRSFFMPFYTNYFNSKN